MEARQACYAFAILTPDDTIRYLSRKYKQARPNVFSNWDGSMAKSVVTMSVFYLKKVAEYTPTSSLIKFDRDI
jgi:hypothetical protein